MEKWIWAERGITGDSSTVLSPAWVGIRDGIISYVDQKEPDPVPEVNVTRLLNATLTPGLMNLHDHISRKFLRNNTLGLAFGVVSKMFMAEDSHYLLLHSVHNAGDALKHGVTFIRDYGLAGLTSIHLRRAIAEGLIEGPEISACGQPICMTGGHTHRQACEADGESAVREAVRRQLKHGADVIKFMASGGLEHFPEEDPYRTELTESEMRVGVEVARSADVPTAAHAYPSSAISNALRAGVDSIEHGVQLTDECIELMCKAEVALVPTVSGLRTASLAGRSGDEFKQFREQLWNRILYPQEESIRRAIKAGVLVGTGTDSGGDLVREIRLLAEIAGETPTEALSRATGVASRIAKRPDLGLLEVGRKAHLVAFAGDLTKSLDCLEQVMQVWYEGRPILENPSDAPPRVAYGSGAVVK